MYHAISLAPWSTDVPDDEPHGESFAREVDDLIDRLKTLPDFILEATYGANLKNKKLREELQAKWREALVNYDAQLMFDTEIQMHDAYANELIFGDVERDRETEGFASIDDARRIVDQFRGRKA